MSAEISSMLIGTAGLSIIGVVALLLTLTRGGIAAELARGVRLAAGVALAVQLLHFTEEFASRFYQQFPALLGLAAWPVTYFMTFNLVWLLLWGLAIACIERLPRAAAFPLWFLGIASVANGVIHPLFAVALAGYFPGLGTGLIAGPSGAFLLHRLVRATTPLPHAH